MTRRMDLQFAQYRQAHRQRLLELADGPDWRAILARPDALRQWCADTIAAPTAPGQLAAATRYLLERNGERATELVAQGVTDQDVLVDALGDWRTALAGDDRFPITFLGLVVTLDCTFVPRCLYCNQTWLPRTLTKDAWKVLLADAADPVPPYVYLTGGEPLLLGAEIWGDDGLVASAARLGCAVNVNTNAALITPHVALQLVKSGLAKLHLSLDCTDPEVQGQLFQGSHRLDAVLAGLHNVQIAREVLGAGHPEVHVNCVVTARSMFQFPDLLRSLLEMRQERSPGYDGPFKDDPLFRNFAFHLIPVGGSENALLRPTVDEWKRFYTDTWAEAEQVWRQYQTDIGVADDESESLESFCPFGNPYLRADHGMSLDEYCENAARGEYWQGALTDRCYVGPTQAFVLPDGSQHWCGGHAIRRPEPLGNVQDDTLRGNIRANLDRWVEHPNANCTGCAGATCVINQAALRGLKKRAAELLDEESR